MSILHEWCLSTTFWFRSRCSDSLHNRHFKKGILFLLLQIPVRFHSYPHHFLKDSVHHFLSSGVSCHGLTKVKNTKSILTSLSSMTTPVPSTGVIDGPPPLYLHSDGTRSKRRRIMHLEKLSIMRNVERKMEEGLSHQQACEAVNIHHTMY